MTEASLNGAGKPLPNQTICKRDVKTSVWPGLAVHLLCLRPIFHIHVQSDSKVCLD